MDFSSVELREEVIPGAKLNGEVKLMTKSDAARWLKCRGARKLSKMTIKELHEK